jgi:cyclase
MKVYILMFDQKAKELASQSDDVKKIATAIQSVLPQRHEGVWLIGPNIQMKYLKKR